MFGLFELFLVCKEAARHKELQRITSSPLETRSWHPWQVTRQLWQRCLWLWQVPDFQTANQTVEHELYFIWSFSKLNWTHHYHLAHGFCKFILMTFCWGKKREGGPNPCSPHLPVMNLSAACCLKCSPECLSVLSLAIIGACSAQTRLVFTTNQFSAQ